MRENATDGSAGAGYRVALYTMGCRTNQYDSSRLADEFRAAGFTLVPYDEAADVYVINTCTVTAQADRDARSASRRALARNPEALVVATGCYPQVDPEPMARIPGVRLVGGNELKADLVRRVCELLAESARADGTRGDEGAERREEPTAGARPGGRSHQGGCQPPPGAVGSDGPRQEGDLSGVSAIGRTRQAVKVEEGCNYGCAYCVVPRARGKARSRPLAEVVAEVCRLAEGGCREVVLTGTCIGTYGKDLSPRVSLAECAAEVAAIAGIERVRISSIEPWEVEEDLVELVANNPVFCPHFHLPLQSGDDGLRRRMRRPGTSAQFADLVARIRARVPDAGITTDVMVGFPGETDAEFEATREFCREMRFSRMHVFRYSARPFTHAATLPDQVARPVADARSRELIRLGSEMGDAFARQWLGRRVRVLVEGAHGPDGLLEGVTGNFIRVCFESGAATRGGFVDVEATEVRDGSLYGRAVTDG